MGFKITQLQKLNQLKVYSNTNKYIYSIMNKFFIKNKIEI